MSAADAELIELIDPLWAWISVLAPIGFALVLIGLGLVAAERTKWRIQANWAPPHDTPEGSPLWFLAGPEPSVTNPSDSTEDSR